MTDKKMKIEFAPGCFDNFDGTQEELDDLIAEIEKMFESGEALENATLLDMDELIEDEPEIAERLFNAFDDDNKRTLQ